MKVVKLTLANYRGFDQIDLDFADDVTVIAGVNGVGKSSVLKALTSAMSLALPRFTVSKEPSLGLSDTDVQYDKSGLSVSLTLRLDATKAIVDLTRSAPLAADKAESLTKRRDDLRFATRETKKGSKEEREINDEIRLIDLQLVKASDIATIRILPNDVTTDADEMAAAVKSGSQQPIAVFYSTSRLLSRLPPSLPKTKKIDAATAYDKSLNQLEVSLNDFASWYRVIKSETPTATKDRLFQQLDQVIKTFLPGVSSLALHEGRPPRFSVAKDNQTLFLEQLSDGERGLLALVFDLTRRLAIANPGSDNPIVEGVALVLIDEIELHLHPKWQRNAIKRLPAIFKNCQFVITTHSPQVIGEVQARCVRLLSIKGGRVISEVPGMAYGADSNWILNVLMGADEMNEDVEKELEHIASLISERKLKDARAKIDDLRSRVGNTETTQKLVSIIERIERIGK